MIKMRDGLVKRFTSQPDAKSQFVDPRDEVGELLLEGKRRHGDNGIPDNFGIQVFHGYAYGLSFQC